VIRKNGRHVAPPDDAQARIEPQETADRAKLRRQKPMPSSNRVSPFSLVLSGMHGQICTA
jgi:hypothetical protein